MATTTLGIWSPQGKIHLLNSESVFPQFRKNKAETSINLANASLFCSEGRCVREMWAEAAAAPNPRDEKLQNQSKARILPLLSLGASSVKRGYTISSQAGQTQG